MPEPIEIAIYSPTSVQTGVGDIYFSLKLVETLFSALTGYPDLAFSLYIITDDKRVLNNTAKTEFTVLSEEDFNQGRKRNSLNPTAVFIGPNLNYDDAVTSILNIPKTAKIILLPEYDYKDEIRSAPFRAALEGFERNGYSCKLLFPGFNETGIGVFFNIPAPREEEPFTQAISPYYLPENEIYFDYQSFGINPAFWHIVAGRISKAPPSTSTNCDLFLINKEAAHGGLFLLYNRLLSNKGATFEAFAHTIGYYFKEIQFVDLNNSNNNYIVKGRFDANRDYFRCVHSDRIPHSDFIKLITKARISSITGDQSLTEGILYSPGFICYERDVPHKFALRLALAGAYEKVFKDKALFPNLTNDDTKELSRIIRVLFDVARPAPTMKEYQNVGSLLEKHEETIRKVHAEIVKTKDISTTLISIVDNIIKAELHKNERIAPFFKGGK